MDYKQKLGYTVLGAVIMLVGLVIGGPSGCEVQEQSEIELERAFLFMVDINSEPVLGIMSIVYIPNGAMLGNEKVGCYYFRIQMVGEKSKNSVVLRLNFYDEKGFSLFASRTRELSHNSDMFSTDMRQCPSGMLCLIREGRWADERWTDDEYDTWQASQVGREWQVIQSKRQVAQSFSEKEVPSAGRQEEKKTDEQDERRADDEYDTWGWTGRFDESCITFEAFRRVARVRTFQF